MTAQCKSFVDGPSRALAESADTPSDVAQRRILSRRVEPLFYADWLRAVFIHYEVDPDALQRDLPFELDLREGRAYVSLVAFTMRGMRPRWGGRLGAALLHPIATHEFLNVRAYVRHRGELGIYFLAEWLPNRLSVCLGPTFFGLPYRLGSLNYRHDHESGQLRGSVMSHRPGQRLEYRVAMNSETRFQPCAAGSLDEFLLERYTAFTCLANTGEARRAGQIGSPKRFFRIWHSPWPQTPVDLRITDASLLKMNWPWFHAAQMIGANYSPGVEQVWMGRPHRMDV